MKGSRLVLPMLLLVAIAFSFPTDIPYTIEGLLNKMDQSLDKVKNPNFSKTYIPPSTVPYVTDRKDSKFIYFNIEVYRSYPFNVIPRYRSVVIYTPIPYYPPVVYVPPAVIYQQMPNYLDIFLLKELMGAREELKETQKEVEKLKERVEQLREKVICPTCKREMDPSWTYCPYDGTPLKKEHKKVSLYALAIAKAYIRDTGGRGFIAVEMSSLEGLSDEDKREVLNQVKSLINSTTVYDLAEVKNDKDKFSLSDEGRIIGAKNGVVVLLKLENYDGDNAKLKVLSWRSYDWMSLIPYEAKFIDGNWQLREVSGT